MLNQIRSFARDESGATMIEYGLIAALVAVAAITALSNMGDSIESIFKDVKTNLDNAENDNVGGDG